MKSLFFSLVAFAMVFSVACDKAPTSPTTEPQQFAPLSIEFFRANPDSISPPGGYSEVCFLVKNATKVTLFPWPGGEVGASGCGSMFFDSTTTMILTAWGKTSSGKDTVASAQVTVKVGELTPPPPDTSYYEILVNPNGVTGNGVDFVGFNSFEHVDEVSLLRTWTLWPAADSVVITRNGVTVAGSDAGWVFVAVKTDTVAGWYQSWETPLSDYGRWGNFQVSFRLRPVTHDVELFINGLRGDIPQFLGHSITDDGSGRPRTVAVWSDVWDSLRVEMDGKHLFGKLGAPHVARLSVAPAPHGWHESWRKSLEDAKRDAIFQVSWWKD